MGEFIRVASISDVPDGKIKKVVVNGKEYALYNVSGNIYASTTVCPHQGGPLDEGELDGNNVVCPWHGWTFDVINGQSAMSSRVKIPVYETKIEQGNIYLNI